MLNRIVQARPGGGAPAMKYVYSPRSAVVQSLRPTSRPMKRTSALLIAALIAAAPMGAAAQDRGRERPERSDRREQTEERPGVSMAQAVQRVSAGRPGRFLGASNRGGVIVVRWEYPGGRVADILVDSGTGRVIGER